MTVANFTDSNTNANVSNITAVIKWGDGEISLGTVQSTGRPYVYTVMGNHSYTILNSSGSYAVTVTIADPSGQTATVTSTALVVTPVLNPIPLTVNFTAGILPSSPVTVGSFFDTTAGTTASNFTATIMWGPGQQTTPGTVTASSTTPGLFLVSGTYLYSVADTYALDIQVQDKEGNSTKIASSAVVTAPLTLSQPITVTLTAGVATGPLTVGSFYDSDTSAVASDFTATINWGAGQQVTPGTVTTSSTPGLFLVSGSYLYPTPGKFALSITVEDNLGNTIPITGYANVVTNVVTTPANVGFTGGLDPDTENGPYANIGYTNTNRPTFSGNAVPFSIVQLYGKYWGVDAVQPLGEAVTNASGQWTLTVGPLATGTYTITATVTPPGSYPVAANVTNDGLVYIDMKPPKHPTVVYHHKKPKHPTPPPPPLPRARSAPSMTDRALEVAKTTVSEHPSPILDQRPLAGRLVV